MKKVIYILLIGLLVHNFFNKMYMSCLFQKSKWIFRNTGTYTYVSNGYLWFIKNHEPVKYGHFENFPNIKNIDSDIDIVSYYSIDNMFNNIENFLWSKSFSINPPDTNIDVVYDNYYGYPKSIVYMEPMGKVVLGESTNEYVAYLMMYPKDTLYTNEVVKGILKEYEFFSRSHVGES